MGLRSAQSVENTGERIGWPISDQPLTDWWEKVLDPQLRVVTIENMGEHLINCDLELPIQMPILMTEMLRSHYLLLHRVTTCMCYPRPARRLSPWFSIIRAVYSEVVKPLLPLLQSHFPHG